MNYKREQSFNNNAIDTIRTQIIPKTINTRNSIEFNLNKSYQNKF